MEELLELQRVKEKEQVEQTRSLKEANAEIRRQKNNQDVMTQKVVTIYVHNVAYIKELLCRKNHCTRTQNSVKGKQIISTWH